MRLTRIVTPDRSGHVIVELPAGKYQVPASVQGRGDATAEALVFGQARNGRLQLSVDTGRWTHPGCFAESAEDLLIPDERVVGGGDKLLKGQPASNP